MPPPFAGGGLVAEANGVLPQVGLVAGVTCYRPLHKGSFFDVLTHGSILVKSYNKTLPLGILMRELKVYFADIA